MIRMGPERQFRLPLELLDFRESLPMGTRAPRVFCNIVNQYKIGEYTVTDYYPGSSYKHDPGQGLHYIEGKPSEKDLYELSAALRKGEVLDFEGTTIDLRKIMAVASVVKMADGTKRHLPMLDFCLEPGPEGVAIIRQSIVLPAGCVLQTDHSYHYFGYKLMGEEEWQDWMLSIRGQKGLLVTLIESSYLDYSLERGYAALRVFRYPEADKNTTPYVVGYCP